jgi:hypothetical protein
MIRIAITATAYEAIAAALPVGSEVGDCQTIST